MFMPGPLRQQQLQDFMDATVTMGLFQWVMAPTHLMGHTLDLTFTGGYGEGERALEERLRSLLCLRQIVAFPHFLPLKGAETSASLAGALQPPSLGTNGLGAGNSSGAR